MDNPAGQRSPWSCDSSSSGCGRPTLRGAHPGSSRNSKMLGIDVAKSTVERYKPRHHKPPSPSWRTFLEQHAHELASIDFFVVPTATLKVLFVLVVLVHDRRQIVHFNVTEHPTAQWTAQHLTEAFPFDTAPALSVARWRWKLWPVGSTKNSVFWYERSHHCADVTMAESLCRTSDRQYPTGASGSRCRP